MFSSGFIARFRRSGRLAAAAACALLLWSQLAVALHDHAGDGDPHGPGDRALACDFCLGHGQAGAPPPAAPRIGLQAPTATLLPAEPTGSFVPSTLPSAHGPRGPPASLSTSS
ncbi:MAG: hypothetical protein ACO4CP_07265 [Steroidobacteraceae bacterium]